VDTTQALVNLKAVSDLLSHLNLTHWVTDGSLLGLIREGKLLDHDLDTDIAVLYQELPSNLISVFESAGFEVVHILGDHSDSLEIAVEKAGVKTDLFFFYRISKFPVPTYRHSAFFDFRQGFYRRVDYHYRLPVLVFWKLFGDFELPVPRFTKRYLEIKYGKDWKKPIVHWNYVEDPANSKKTNIFYDEAKMAEELATYLEFSN
jgi:hypothetical protein